MYTRMDVVVWEEGNLSEFKANLVYMESSKPVMATQWDFITNITNK